VNISDIKYDHWLRELRSRRSAVRPELTWMLDLFIEHMEAARSLDFTRFVAPMHSDLLYREFGVRESQLTLIEVGAIYRSIVSKAGWPESEMTIERLLVDDGGLAIDGVLRVAATKAQLVRESVPPPPGTSDDDMFVISRRHALFLEFKDRKFWRHDAYICSPTVESARPS